MKGATLLLSLLLSLNTIAQDDPPKNWNIHFQTTYVYQYKPTFHSPYNGTNSLKGMEENQNSLTATLLAGVRLWKGAFLYVNPELAGGSGLSGAVGMGGSSNGETFRVGDPSPTLYLGRAYLQQKIALDSETGIVDEGANELGGRQPVNYVEFRAGKLSLGDLFDNNEFSNSPRTQFLNWALMNNGAWDYAANVRGYTYALTGSLQMNGFSLHGAIAALPTTANGSDLDGRIGKRFSVNVEAGKQLKINDHTGNLRLLYYMNKAPMGNYNRAIATAGNSTPDITATRVDGRTKHGLGLSYDQELNKYIGLFARAGWNDGKNETWCFTEIDQAVSAGISFKGEKWERKNDNAGIAIFVDRLSASHKEYLGKGGDGFMLGDGQLNYAPEYATELYYSFKPAIKDIWLSADYQFMINPGYNKDRGPVNIFSLRVHVEL